MKPLFTDEEFTIAKPNDLLPCECYYCHKTYHMCKHEVQAALNPHHSKKGKYCSKECQSQSQINKVEVHCTNCDAVFKMYLNQTKKSKNHFCSQSCSGTYNNKHKTVGNRRSKLEIFIEEQLKSLCQDYEILFNDKQAINSELDIYIPSLKLAFELNGIFHYEPIYGRDKLGQIQNNDNRKFQACLENGIELCIIDTSAQKNFKKEKSITYLNIILQVILLKRNIVPPVGFEPTCP